MQNNIRILIIDDNPADSYLLKRFFGKVPSWNLILQTAQSGSEGFEINKDFNADIIFVDYLLSGETGIDVIENFLIRNGISAYYILLTGYGSESVVTKALRVGVNDYINKDELSPETLERTLRHFIQKKKTEDKLKVTESKLKKIIENTDTGFVLLDESGFILEANEPFLRLIKESSYQNVHKQSIYNWIEKDCLVLFEEALYQCIKEGTLSDFETVFVQSNNELLNIQISASAEKNENETLISALCKNITERKKYEKELTDSRRKAEESDKLKSAFLTNLSHEIRTPMNAIIGFSNLLTQNAITEDERNEYINHIITSGNSLLKMFDDIIELSKIVAEQVKPEVVKCYINNLFQELFTYYSDFIRDTTAVELKLSIPNNSPYFAINTDTGRLRQIMSNLIDNAIKFTEKGTIEFGYFIYSNQEIRFFVKDTGIGISKEKHLLIFERFTKIDDNPQKIYQGSGLGLAITKSLVEILGGKIWLNSEPDKGSEFIFSLPLLFSEHTEFVGSTSATLQNNYLFDKKTILIAEDEETNYLFLNIVIQKTGAKVFWAKDGKEAVQICEQNHVDLILMDIKMPVMHGYDAAKIIKQKNPDIIIIAQTAYAMSGEKEKILKAGFNDYISKPIRKNDLLLLLDKYLQGN